MIFLKIIIIEDPNINDTEVSIVCAKKTNEIDDIVSKISAMGVTIAGKKEQEIFLISLKDIFYFESVDGNV